MLWGRFHHGCMRTTQQRHDKGRGVPGILAHMTFTLCLIEDCEYEGVTRGLCRNHYQTARKAGTLDQVALPKKRPLAEEHGALVLELWNDGLLMSEIAEHVGITPPTVKAVLDKLGVQNPGRHTPESLLRKQNPQQNNDELNRLDHLPAAEAVSHAWNDPELDPAVLAAAQDKIRQTMPLLARALERFVSEAKPDS